MKGAYIVHVDDDRDDAQWLKESFRLYSSIAVSHFPNANSFLSAIPSFKNGNTPCLFVIDLNLPDIKGLELIEKIKEDRCFDQVPIVMYTTGYSPADKTVCDKLGIELFKKPNTVKEWEAICKIMALRCNHSLMSSETDGHSL